MDDVWDSFQLLPAEKQAEFLSRLNQNGAAATGGASPGNPDQYQTPTPSVQQLISLNPDSIVKDAGLCTETINRLQVWSERRQKIINKLKKAADDITAIHKVSRDVDIAGTSLSLMGSSGAAVGVTAALYFSTAPVSIPAFGALTMAGGTVSAGSQLIRNGLVEKHKKKLKSILEEDGKDMAELKKLMGALDGALERLQKIEGVLKYIFIFGQVGIEKLIADQLSEENTKMVLQIVEYILNNDQFITYMATTVETVSTVGINSMSDEIDWELFIKFSAKIFTGLTTLKVGRSILNTVTEGRCTSSFVTKSSGILVINVLTIGMDVYNLINKWTEANQSDDPEIVNQIREATQQLQKQLDSLPKKKVKID